MLGKATYTVLTGEKLLVIKSRIKLVRRLKLGTMVQGGDETITSFETWLKPVASTWRFQQLTDYTD